MPKGMPGQRKVGFTFPAELVERLEEAKWELRKTKAEIVIEAVEEYLDRHGIKESRSATTGTTTDASTGISLNSVGRALLRWGLWPVHGEAKVADHPRGRRPTSQTFAWNPGV